MKKSIEERFDAKVQKSDGCWNWTAAKTDWGYGLLGIDGHAVRAHRLSYERYVGPIPDGMYVLHRCDNPACVRPEHLFLGTLADNSRDMVAKGRNRGGTGGKPTCAKGHPFSPENTFVENGARRCRTCIRQRSLACYHRRKHLRPRRSPSSGQNQERT